MLRTEVYQNNLVGVIVDEAHCVETWIDFAHVMLHIMLSQGRKVSC